jgi:membrane protein YqaA with SNARE-associated domain
LQNFSSDWLLPLFVLIFFAGGLLNPFLVGVIAGIGSAIGELVAYAVGFGGRRVIDRKKVKLKKRGLGQWLRRGEAWMHKRGGFFVIFIFALTPLPDDVIGIICGSIKYDIKRFFIACALGKIILSLGLAYAGYYGLGWVLGYIT